MRRRNATIAVSLFPFLAVLLCAMGALILLLLIMSRQIREDALATIAASAPAPATPVEPPAAIPTVTITIYDPAPPAPPDPNVELRSRLAAGTARRDAARREVERLRILLAARKDATTAAYERSAAASFDLEAARNRLAAREAELRDRDAERRRLLEEIRVARGTLAKVRQQAESAEPKVSIVPYDGRSGTARRPVLIECRGETIRFVPEDVRLTAADLEGFLPDFNPLLAGASALRSHWYEVDGGGTSRPYVLLLVHEDGVAAYYAARALLRTIGNDTGYELVTDDLPLAIPPVDPKAQQVCRTAVLEALERRGEALTQLARRARNEPASSGLFDDPFDGAPPFGGEGASPAPPIAPLPSGRSIAGLDETPAEDASGETSAAAGGAVAGAADGSPAGRIARQIGEANRRSRAAGLAPPAALPSEVAAELAREEAFFDRLPELGGRLAGKKKWGASAPTANISLERPMPVVVTAEQITVGAQPPIPLTDGVTDATVGAVFEAVDREAAAWGRSPGQFYWSPRLRATIRPGGTAHYDRLRRRLAGTGLTAGDRIELAPPVPAFVELRYAQAVP